MVANKGMGSSTSFQMNLPNQVEDISFFQQFQTMAEANLQSLEVPVRTQTTSPPTSAENWHNEDGRVVDSDLVTANPRPCSVAMGDSEGTVGKDLSSQQGGVMPAMQDSWATYLTIGEPSTCNGHNRSHDQGTSGGPGT